MAEHTSFILKAIRVEADSLSAVFLFANYKTQTSLLCLHRSVFFFNVHLF